MKVIKALLVSVEFIRTNKAEILGLLEKNWGIKNPAVREGFYGDMLGLYSRTGIVSDETIANVVRFYSSNAENPEKYFRGRYHRLDFRGKSQRRPKTIRL